MRLLLRAVVLGAAACGAGAKRDANEAFNKASKPACPKYDFSRIVSTARPTAAPSAPASAVRTDCTSMRGWGNGPSLPLPRTTLWTTFCATLTGEVGALFFARVHNM